MQSHISYLAESLLLNFVSMPLNRTQWEHVNMFAEIADVACRRG